MAPKDENPIDRMICMSFDVDPVPKGRPRMGKWGAYTPQKTRDAEATLKYLMNLHPNRPVRPFTGPLRVYLDFHLPIPRSWSKKRAQEILNGGSCHAQRPDIDNLTKLVADAGNGILWEDDAQIVELVCSKHWAVSGRIELRMQ